MGNKCHEAKSVCIDVFTQDFNDQYIPPNPVIPDNANNIFNNSSRSLMNANNGRSSVSLIPNNEVRPSPQYIDSYNAYNNFFLIMNSANKIQRAFRRYIFKRKRLKIRHISAKENINKKTESKIVNEELPDINIQQLDLFHMQTVTSFMSTSSLKEGEGAEDKMKGYFLSKKKKYTYQGYSKNKIKEGFGKIKWEDGGTLKAYFSGSKVNGICEFKDRNMTFEGFYINNRPMGYGIFRRGNNVIFEGVWNKNVQNEIGIAKWNDNTSYEGEFVNSVKTGIGTYIWPDGTKYQGELINNQLTGYGIIQHTDNRLYYGQVVNGEMEGFGQFNWSDGKKYIGDYKRDKKHGLGMYYWSKKPLDVYFGFWESGKQNGPGIKINGKIMKYGIWKDGAMDTILQKPLELVNYIPSDQNKYKRLFEKKLQKIFLIYVDII